jgi:hypothetical protein
VKLGETNDLGRTNGRELAVSAQTLLLITVRNEIR